MKNTLNLGHVVGSDGAPGPAGADGKGPYEIAVEEGYTGTESEFYAALVGLKEAPFLPLSGGTMEGNIKIPQEYGIFTLIEDNKESIRISGGGISFIAGEGGFYICNESDIDSKPIAAFYGLFGDESVIIRYIADPEMDADAVNKRYVDNLVGDVASMIDIINGEVI